MEAELIKQINTQINLEFFSSYFYLNISNFYLSENLDGFSHWFSVQEKEERDHAVMFMQYLQHNDYDVVLDAIASPHKAYASFEEPLQLAYQHEKSVSKRIHELYDLAFTQKDFGTMQFLDWFVKEQQEEEKSIKTICEKYHLFVNDQKNLYMLDSELKSRVYVPTLFDQIN